MSIVTTRCTRCRAEFNDEQLQGATACPECGTTGVPMRISEDVTVRINRHELRIITVWASNYATERCEREAREALAAILHSLALQHPDKPPLTLAGEIAQIRQEFGEVETNVRDLLDDEDAA